MLLLLLVACRGPVPGLGFLGGAFAGAPDSTPGAAGDPAAGGGRAASAPVLEALEPDNGGVGAVFHLKGRSLAANGTKVFFGDREIGFSVETDGRLRARVPEGAQNALVRVERGGEQSAKPFRVTARLVLNLLKALPAAVGLPLPVTVDGYDTAGAAIQDPAFDLLVDPPEAADVVGRTGVVPRRVGTFAIQAVSGQAEDIKNATSCKGDFRLEDYIGDGHPYQIYGGPQLMHATQSVKASEAHLLRPWGLINDFQLGAEKGLLFADSGSGRLRFVPDGGASIKTVMGGGNMVPIATDSAAAVDYDPLKIELLEPAGLAIGKDIDDQATESVRDVVVIAERGRHRILAWYYTKAPPNVRVIAGTGNPTFTRQTATDSALVQSQALGDQDIPKKVCGEPTSATFWDPAGVAITNREIKVNNKPLFRVAEIFVADTNNHVVRRIVRKTPSEVAKDFNAAGCSQGNLKAKTGIIITVVGNGKAGDSIAVAEASGSAINAPLDVALDPTNGLDVPILVSDSNNNRILQVKGAMTVPEEGTPSFGIDVIAPPAAHDLAPLGHPAGLYLQPVTGTLLIADTLRNRVLLVPKTRTTMAEVGSCSLEATPSAGLVWPRAIAPVKIDGAGVDAKVETFVSDFLSNRIRRLKNFPN